MIQLYEPQLEDLWFKEAMLSDEETMSYNHAYGGTISFPKERWKSWFDRWVVNHETKRFYRYIREKDTFVGEAAYHLDEQQQIFLADVIVYAPHRGKGYGRAALLLLCEAAKEKGIAELYDEIATDNPGISLFFSCGFQEVQRTDAGILIKKELKHCH